jgi:hypothetical protein
VKSEARNPKSEGNPKSETGGKPGARWGISGFGLGISDLFRISGFGFRILTALAVSTSAAPLTSRVTFEDVTATASVIFKHTMGASELTSLVQATGVGCAFLDHDNDGWLDIYLVNGGFLPGLGASDTLATAASPSPPQEERAGERRPSLFHERRPL